MPPITANARPANAIVGGVGTLFWTANSKVAMGLISVMNSLGSNTVATLSLLISGSLSQAALYKLPPIVPNGMANVSPKSAVISSVPNAVIMAFAAANASVWSPKKGVRD